MQRFETRLGYQPIHLNLRYSLYLTARDPERSEPLGLERETLHCDEIHQHEVHI